MGEIDLQFTARFFQASPELSSEALFMTPLPVSFTTAGRHPLQRFSKALKRWPMVSFPIPHL